MAGLPDAERHRVLVEWNRTAAPRPLGVGVHHLVEAQAVRTPGSTAVVDDRRSLTYADLVARSRRLASRLRSLDVGPEVVVGVCLRRGVDMVVALLAVLEAGGAYLPLDPEYPSDRVRFMLDDSAAAVVVTQEPLRSRLPTSDAHVVCMDDDPPVSGDQAAPGSADGFDPEQLAYLIYTSGSTGQPKGVQIPHRAMTNFLTTMAERPGMSAADVLVAVTTLSFDIAGLELFLPLTVGARVVVAPAEVASAPGPLVELLDASAVTVLQATPATWRMLVDAGWSGREGLKILCGGEALPVSLAAALLDRGAELWNMYGPTETTVWSTTVRVTTPDRARSIGRPIANTTVYILDDSLEPVAVGTPGELHIGGAGLARGYLRRPELTAERFIRHPFDPAPGARLYRTGDLARWRPDGEIEFLGRLDHQVKVRGFRIELGEIEAALEDQPGVRAAIVVAGPDGSGSSRLIAYTVPDGAGSTVTELRQGLLERLPGHMMPSAFVMLDAFPLTPNGKVDRKALPPPEGSRPAVVTALVTPRNPLERTLAGIWTEVLGVDEVGVEDDFFELGGHSLLAVRVVGRVREALEVELALGALYGAPTVAELATLVAAGEGCRDAPPLVALDRSLFLR
jgi:amino acid adenylation domain-containing protein